MCGGGAVLFGSNNAEDDDEFLELKKLNVEFDTFFRDELSMAAVEDTMVEEQIGELWGDHMENPESLVTNSS